ncbi:UPF0309 protein [Spirochaetia bacterium]|nr:UPF0309 protein [Spirochaetia bacterium]
MLAQDYFNKIGKLIETLRDTQSGAIQKAAEEIAPRLERGGILYTFGSGHSHMIAEEIAKRAGGLLQVRAILPYELTLDPTPYKTMYMERLEGLAEVIFATVKIRPEDALIVISNSGRNAVPVRLAQGAKERGIFTVALTNLTHSTGVASRTKDNRKLYEVADVVLDSCGPLGDATIQPPGRDWAVGPVSTLAGVALMEALVCGIVEIMLAHGSEPAVLRSANLDGGDEYNHRVLAELLERFPALKELDITL